MTFHSRESFLKSKFQLSAETLAAMMSIPYMISAVSSPFLGGLVDLIGMRAVLLIVSSAALACAHATLSFTLVSPLLPLIAIGVSYRQAPVYLPPLSCVA